MNLGKGWFSAVLISIASLTLLASLGCGEKAKGTSLDAAIVPGADFFVRLDVGSARQSAFGKYLEQMQHDLSEEPSSASQWSKFDIGDRLIKATGLKRDDVTAILVSGDVDSVNPRGPEQRGRNRQSQRGVGCKPGKTPRHR